MKISAEEWDNLPQFVHERVYLEDRTLGSWYDDRAGLICKVLELAWRDNKNSVSCIPEDEYLVTWSPPVKKDDPNTPEDESGGRHERPYEHYIIHDVPNRRGILVHIGIDIKNSLGCQLVASRFAKIDSPQPILSGSREKLLWMTQTLPHKFRLLIESKSGVPYK